jgi:hypothetical protein
MWDTPAAVQYRYFHPGPGRIEVAIRDQLLSGAPDRLVGPGWRRPGCPGQVNAGQVTLDRS